MYLAFTLKESAAGWKVLESQAMGVSSDGGLDKL